MHKLIVGFETIDKMDEAFVPQAGLHGNLDGFRLRGITPGKASIPANVPSALMARALAYMQLLMVGRNASPCKKPSLPPLASMEAIEYSVTSAIGSIK